MRSSPLLPVVSFVFAAAASAQGIVLEGPEPNDAPGSATTLVAGEQGDGHLAAPGGDVDWWRVDVSVTSDLSAWVTSRGAVLGFAGTSIDDTELTLYGTDGATVLATNDDYTGRPFVARGFFSTLHVRDLPPGTYFLQVEAWSLLGVGDYGLDVRLTTPLVDCTSFAAGPTEAEPNDAANDLGVATVASCERASGAIAGPSDADHWRFTVAADSRVVLDTLGDAQFGTPIFDTRLWLYASDGVTELAFDDDGGDNFLARIEVELTAGTYFARVETFQLPGDYELELDVAPIPGGILERGEVSADDSNAGCLGSNGLAMRIVPRKNEWPTIGTVFVSDVTGAIAPPQALFGFAPVAPVDLGIIGMPGCALAQSVAGTIATSPTVPGEHRLVLTLPDDPGFDGLSVFLQVASIDFGANPLGVTLSNRIELRPGIDR